MPTARLRDIEKKRGKSAAKQNGHAKATRQIEKVFGGRTAPLTGDAGCRSVPAERNGLGGVGRDLPLRAITSSPFNPRKHFPATEIAALAATMTEHGLLEPIIVRPLEGERYELVAGERRFRAAQLLRWVLIPAIIRQLDDAEAREICLLENLQRKDLNAIEEAQAMQAMLAGADAPTQAVLAGRLGVSQPHVANRLGLLRLPAAITARIISGEIPPSLARPLVKFAEAPAVLKGVVENLHGKLDVAAGETRNADEIDDAILGALADEACQLGCEVYDTKTNRRNPCFEPTAEQRAELVIVKHESYGGKPVEYATNVKLFEKLQAEHAARLEQRAEGRGQKAKKENGKPLSAAEQKQFKAAEVQRAKKSGSQFQRRLYEWCTDAKRYLIAEAIDTAHDPLVSPAEVEAIAVYLQINLDAAWRKNQIGPRAESYWRLHTKEQLVALAKEVNAEFTGEELRGSKKQLVASLLARRPTKDNKRTGLRMPKEILKVKRS